MIERQICHVLVLHLSINFDIERETTSRVEPQYEFTKPVNRNYAIKVLPC